MRGNRLVLDEDNNVVLTSNSINYIISESHFLNINPSDHGNFHYYTVKSLVGVTQDYTAYWTNIVKRNGLAEGAIVPGDSI